MIEVGFGNGEFLVQLAERFPGWNIIGADTSPSSIVRARRRIRRSSIPNVRLYCGDGRFVVRHVAAESGLYRLYVNFPDPWPRRRHSRRRLLSPDFLRLAASRLSEEGAIWLTTDHPGYFAVARASVAETGLFRTEERPPPAETLETRWARRWLDQDRPIYHALFHKMAEPGQAAARLEPTLMQHALMRGDLSGVAGFEKTVYRRGAATIVLADAFRSLDGASLVFTVIVDEDDLSQQALIEARPRDPDILVGVARFGKPLSTKGLNEAVRCVAEYLEGCGLETVRVG